MKACFIRNKLIAAGIVIAAWQILSMIYPPVVIPKISAVIKAVAEIIGTKDLWNEILRTCFRLVSGVLLGIVFGAATGFLNSINKTFREISINFIKLLQVIPPVAILILTIVWLGYNGKPAIAITAVAVFPTIAITVQDSILNLDKKLLEMAEVFCFSKTKKIKLIIWPSIKPVVCSGLKIALGNASKTVVMGEVLTTATGIGGQILTARLNIESEKIIAWTIISVFIYLLLGKLAVLIFREKNGDKNA
ncbi:MAG: ABC transporter permease subunit [Spirochaetales bacterium]|nr:ABC transporter permease subunit [Spirochaetales bacterium]